MFTATWGVDDIGEGFARFDTQEEALQFAKDKYDMNDGEIEMLRDYGRLESPTVHGIDYFEIEAS